MEGWPIPHEILNEILFYLGLSSDFLHVITCSRVCKHWFKSLKPNISIFIERNRSPSFTNRHIEKVLGLVTTYENDITNLTHDEYIYILDK